MYSRSGKGVPIASPVAGENFRNFVLRGEMAVFEPPPDQRMKEIFGYAKNRNLRNLLGNNINSLITVLNSFEIMNYYFLGAKTGFEQVLATEMKARSTVISNAQDQSFYCTSNCFSKLDFSSVCGIFLFRVTGLLSPNLGSVRRLAKTCIRSAGIFGTEGGSIEGVVEFSKPKRRERPEKIYFSISLMDPQFVVFYWDSLGPNARSSDFWKSMIRVGEKHGAVEAPRGLALTCPLANFTEEYILDLTQATKKDIVSVFWNAGSMGQEEKDFIDTILSSNFDADHYTLELGGNFTSALFIKEFQKIMDETSRCFYSFCPIVLKETKKKRDTLPAIDFGVTFTRDEYQYVAISTVPIHQDSSIPLERARKLIDELGIDIKTPVEKEEVLREATEDF